MLSDHRCSGILLQWCAQRAREKRPARWLKFPFDREITFYCKCALCKFQNGGWSRLWHRVAHGKCVAVDSGMDVKWGYSQLRNSVPYTMFFFGFSLSLQYLTKLAYTELVHPFGPLFHPFPRLSRLKGLLGNGIHSKNYTISLIYV